MDVAQTNKTPSDRRTMPRPLIYTLISAAGLLLIGSLTNPSSTHPVVLAAVFTFMFTTFYFGFRMASQVVPGIRGVTDKRKRLVAASASGVTTLLLLLQSIGQLSIRDVITVGVFCLLSYFYVSKYGNFDAV